MLTLIITSEIPATIIIKKIKIVRKMVWKI